MGNYNMSYASGKLNYQDAAGNSCIIITPAWVAPEYTKTTYAKNQLVMHEGKLYYANQQLVLLKIGLHLIGRKQRSQQ